MTLLQHIHDLGQQIWLDNLSRQLLREGQLAHLITQQGVAGITTNPAIFHSAITEARYYAADLAQLHQQPISAEQRYEQLAIADVREAADLLAPLYQQSDGEAGYVSLEVSPALADDAAATVAAGKRLKQAVDRDNLLIKVPATTAGLDAIAELLGNGISVNVTLMFSLSHVDNVAKAYLKGLRLLQARGGNLAGVRSVASLFLSRIDSLVDSQLEEQQSQHALSLRGKTGVALAKLAYQRHQTLFASKAFTALRQQHARPQSMLWASTGIKNPAYSDLLYVEPLIGADTINTLPQATLAALLDHGRVEAATLGRDTAAASDQFAALKQQGIDLEANGELLQQQGLAQFETAFAQLLKLMA